MLIIRETFFYINAKFDYVMSGFGVIKIVFKLKKIEQKYRNNNINTVTMTARLEIQNIKEWRRKWRRQHYTINIAGITKIASTAATISMQTFTKEKRSQMEYIYLNPRRLTVASTESKLLLI